MTTQSKKINMGIVEHAILGWFFNKHGTVTTDSTHS
jgi:hypothetical protein